MVATDPSRPGLRRYAGAGALALVLGGAAVLALPALASAHVEIKPGEVEGGDFTQVAFTVPNERDDASTTKLVVDLPADQPLASVQTTPVAGWTVTTKERTLDEPIDFFGTPKDKVVSQITWTAMDGGISPGEFQNFTVSLGVLPTSGVLTFKAVQTYSSGEVVKWDEVAAAGAEPEHPAPTLTLTAPAEGSGHSDSSESTDSQTAALGTGASDTAAGEGDSSTTVSLALSIAALVASIAALALSWRRSRA
jgi:periplasmic copper chaperone A